MGGPWDMLAHNHLPQWYVVLTLHLVENLVLLFEKYMIFILRAVLI